MSILFKIKKQLGFTFIETVIYIAIVGIVLVAIVSLHLTIGETSAKLANNIDVSRNRREALQAIDFLVRNADGLLKDVNQDCSDFDASPPVLSLYFEDDTYLPGTCVESGGGAEITVSSGRLILNCYPNIANNGQYQACSASLGNTYYLTDPLVNVANDGFSLSTSTVTSTISGFLGVTTHLIVTQTSFEDTRLQATSTATSTSVARNEKVSGLVGWWRLDDDDGSAAVDMTGNNDWICSPAATPAALPLHSASTDSFAMIEASSATCYMPDDPLINFDDQFTLSTWLYPVSYSSGDIYLFRKRMGNYGYGMYLTDTDHYVGCEVCNSSSCSQFESTYVVDELAYHHITCSYDYPNDTMTIYAFQRFSADRATTTFSSLPLLINTTSSLGISTSTLFNGYMGDVRFHNRVITPEEINAMRSGG